MSATEWQDGHTCATCHRNLIGEEVLGGQCFMCRMSSLDAVQLLESARIDWKRDWDAVAVGMALGALAVGAIWGWVGSAVCQ